MSCDTTWQPRPASSTEYLWATIDSQANDGTALDPTSDPVAFAFLPLGDESPDDPDFNDGTWRTVSGEYQAGILVGPENDGIPLDPGRYRVYVRVTDNPEIPIRRIDQVLHITRAGEGS